MRLDEFLLARIAEDEAAARDEGAGAMMGAMWKQFPEDAYHELQRGVLANAARVLAECDAKRRIVALHPEMLESCQGCAHEAHPCRTLRALAQPYVDHPGFDPAWRV